ncbi:MAG: hypothetical protein ACTSYF_08795, partial [Promethearchaeota archaeon]
FKNWYLDKNNFDENNEYYDYDTYLRKKYPGYDQFIKLGRNFEGAIHIIKKFGTEIGAQFLNDFYNDIIKGLSDKLTDDIFNSKEKANNVLISQLWNWLENKIEDDDEISKNLGLYSLSKKEREARLNNFKKIIMGDNKDEESWFKERFADPVSTMDEKKFRTIVGIFADEFVLLKILDFICETSKFGIEDGQISINKLFWHLKNFYDDYKESKLFRTLFFQLIMDSKSTYSFINYFVQSFFESPSILIPAYQLNPSSFIGAIGERILFEDLVLQALAKVYSLSDFSNDFTSYHAIQFMSIFSGKKFEDFVEKVMENPETFRLVKCIDNNGVKFYPFEGVSMKTFVDIMAGFFIKSIDSPNKEIEIFLASFESKYSRHNFEIEANKDIINNVVVDHYRTIHANKFLVIKKALEGYKVRSFTSLEEYALPLKDDNNDNNEERLSTVFEDIWKAINEIKSPLDFISRGRFGDTGKGDLENQINFNLIEVLNDKLKSFIIYKMSIGESVSQKDVKVFLSDKLKQFLSYKLGIAKLSDNDCNLYESTSKDLIKELMGKIDELGISKEKRTKVKEQIREAFEKIIQNLDTLLVKTDLGFELVSEESLRAYVELDNVVLSKEFLEKYDLFIILDDSGDIKDANDITDTEEELKNLHVPFIWVYQENTGRRGLMRADYLLSTGSDGKGEVKCRQLPDGVQVGFLLDGEVIENIYAFNEHGNFLSGRISISDGSLVDNGDKWYENKDFIPKPRYAEKIIDGKIKKVLEFTYWRSSLKVTGRGISGHLEKVASTINPLDIYKSKIKAKLDSYVPEGADINVDSVNIIDKETYEKSEDLKAIGNLFVPIISSFTYIENLKRSASKKFGKNYVSIDVSDGIMTLFDDKKTLENKLKGLMPAAKRALEGQDWIEQLTLCKYTDDSKMEVKIRDGLKNEDFEFNFYKAWAQVIIEDLKVSDDQGVGRGEDSDFDKFRVLFAEYSGMELNDLLNEGNEERKSEFIELVREALIDYFGFPGFILLVMGMLVFSEEKSGGKSFVSIDYIFHAQDELSELIVPLLGCAVFTSSFNYNQGKTYIKDLNKKFPFKGSITYLISALFFGTQKIKNPFLGSEVIGQFFKSQDYLEYLEYFEDKEKGKGQLFTKLIDSLLRLFIHVDKRAGREEVKASIQAIFDDNNLEAREYLITKLLPLIRDQVNKEKINGHAKDAVIVQFIRQVIDPDLYYGNDPKENVNTGDIVWTIKDAYFGGSDLVLKFKVGKKDKAIQVKIMHYELVEIIEDPKYFGKILITFLFHYTLKGYVRNKNQFCTDARDISLYRIFFSKMKDVHPLLFRKFVNAYGYYEEFFSKLSEGQEKNSKQLVFKFYRLRNKKYFDDTTTSRLSNLPEYESYMIVFDNTKSSERRRAIASALLHMIEKPDVFMTCEFYNKKKPTSGTEFILLASLFRIHDKSVLSKKKDRLGGVDPQLLRFDFASMEGQEKLKGFKNSYNDFVKAYDELVEKYNGMKLETNSDNTPKLDSKSNPIYTFIYTEDGELKNLFRDEDIVYFMGCHDENGQYITYRFLFTAFLEYLIQEYINDEKDNKKFGIESIYYLGKVKNQIDIWDLHRPPETGFEASKIGFKYYKNGEMIEIIWNDDEGEH